MQYKLGEILNKTIGKYLIREELGGGSTAYVYKGIDTTTQRIVAVKILHEYLRKNSTIVERFRREAKVIARLSHPNIIEFIDYYEDEEHFLYVMEFLATYTLEDILDKKQRLPVRLAIPIMEELCDALSYAHALKIVHRDLKPSNLFISRDRGLLLSDFGLAKPLSDAPITTVGSKMMGTPHFMSPEQVNGDETTFRTDIYQVGLIIFQTITGDLPFSGDNHFEAIMARTQRLPIFTKEQKQLVPPRIQTIILKATAVDPKDRYSEAIELKEALEEAIC